MEKQTIKYLIKDYQKMAREIEYVQRDMEFDENANYILIGVRRAGKSYMMYQDIYCQILSGKISAERFVYLNFEDERLCGIKKEELNLIIESYQEMYGMEKPYIYFDKIQNIDGWEKFVRRLADMKYRIMVTGSNAKMLSSDIATTLGGRFIPRYVYPFSFHEFTKFYSIELNENWEYDHGKCVSVFNAFEQYFEYGGFSECYRLQNKIEYLNSLYQKILLGDIVQRHQIRNPRVFRLLGKKTAESIMQPVSLSRMKNIIQSTGDNVSFPLLKDYYDYMTDACLIFELPNMASRLAQRETIKKKYFIDNGILRVFLTDNISPMLENLVAVTLFRKFRSDEEPRLFYYNKGVEIDFCIPEEKLAIQVSVDISQSIDTYSREMSSLLKFLDANEEYSGLIITYNQEKVISTGNRDINVVPIWKWLLK